jgi:hypothetical protein
LGKELLRFRYATTPWLLLTPDLQVVRGAQKFTRAQGLLGMPLIASRKSMRTATIRKNLLIFDKDCVSHQ